MRMVAFNFCLVEASTRLSDIMVSAFCRLADFGTSDLVANFQKLIFLMYEEKKLTKERDREKN